MPPLQLGVLDGQSELLTHCTHMFFKQAGVDVPAQSALLPHCTHCRVVGSQTLCEAGQSAAVAQPTQAPVTLSQTGALLSCCWHCWLPVHAARQV